jgi:hypothetical protein
MPKMVCIGRKQSKVLWTIIVPNSVSMVDDFIREKPSAKNLFHHKAMLSNVSLLSCTGMAGGKEQDISVLVHDPPPFPSGIPLPRTTAGIKPAIRTARNTKGIQGLTDTTATGLKPICDLIQSQPCLIQFRCGLTAGIGPRKVLPLHVLYSKRESPTGEPILPDRTRQRKWSARNYAGRISITISMFLLTTTTGRVASGITTAARRW